MECEGVPIGMKAIPPLTMHTVGELDLFAPFGTQPHVYLYLITPGTVVKRKWLGVRSPFTVIDHVMTGIKVGTIYRVIVGGLHLDLIEQAFARAAKLDAITLIQNNAQLIPIQQEIRDLAGKYRVPILLLNKPANRATQNG